MKQPNFHLITHILCPYVQRSIIILKEKNIPFSRIDIDLANTPDWFKQQSPLGKVPLLLVDENRALFESAVICEYLDEVTPDSLLPSDSLEKAYHRAWIEFGSSILNDIGALYNASDSEDFQNIHVGIQQKFQLIEKEIIGTPFFAGQQFHMIDAVYGPIFRYFDVFDRFADLNTFSDLPKCQSWRQTLAQRESIQLAVSTDYPTLLTQFLAERGSYISQLIESASSS